MTSTIQITFACDNAALADGCAEDRADAAANVLATCGYALRAHWLADAKYPIFDSNGNKIGAMVLSGFED